MSAKIVAVTPVHNVIISHDDEATRADPGDVKKVISGVYKHGGKARWTTKSGEGGRQNGTQVRLRLVNSVNSTLSEALTHVLNHELCVGRGGGVVQHGQCGRVILDGGVVGGCCIVQRDGVSGEFDGKGLATGGVARGAERVGGAHGACRRGKPAAWGGCGGGGKTEGKRVEKGGVHGWRAIGRRWGEGVAV